MHLIEAASTYWPVDLIATAPPSAAITQATLFYYGFMEGGSLFHQQTTPSVPRLAGQWVFYEDGPTGRDRDDCAGCTDGKKEEDGG